MKPVHIKETTIDELVARVKAKAEAYDNMSQEEKQVHDEKMSSLLKKIQGPGLMAFKVEKLK